MWRLVFTVGGLACLLAGHLVVWLTTGQARSALGWGLDAAPKDVAVAYVALVSLGFVAFVGSALEAGYNTWVSVLTSGHHISRDVAIMRRGDGPHLVERLLWGLPPYLVIALVFGLYVRLGLEHQSFTPWMLADPAFLAFSYSWPYHFMAVAGVWGFAPHQFY